VANLFFCHTLYRTYLWLLYCCRIFHKSFVFLLFRNALADSEHVVAFYRRSEKKYISVSLNEQVLFVEGYTVSIDYKRIGRNIKEARRSTGLTQEKLAEHTGLSINHISHVEIGSSPVSLPSLIKICETLNTTADRLLYDNLSQPTAHIDAVVAECFADATPQEAIVMLAVAQSAKQAMRH
jgi:transcriptional regulator with XRE-family HTH domain